MRAIATAILLAFTSVGWAQPAEEYKTLKATYTDQPAVYEERICDVEIRYSKKEGIRFIVNDREQLFILTDNALPFATGTEYFSKEYKIEKIKAYTLIPEAKGYRKLEVKDFKQSSETSDYVFFDDQQVYNYTYPSVCQGAKLVEETTFNWAKPENPISFFFGLGLPTILAKYTVTFPENVKIDYRLYGLDTSKIHLTKTKKGKTWIYVWEAKNMASILVELNAPESRYNIPHIIVNIASYTTDAGTIPVMGSLPDLYKWNYSKISGINLELNSEIKFLADSITRGIADEQQKVAHIFSWVQKNIRYVAIEDGENGVVPREAVLVFHRRYGDCKDKTSILYALISAIGADVSFAWIGTRTLPYKYSDFPSTMVDNHMIAVYRNPQEKVFFLDGTTHYHAMGFPPIEIQGKECLVSRGPGKYDLLEVPISSPETNTVIDSVWAVVSHDTLMGNGRVYFCGEAKSNAINAFSDFAKNDYPKIFSRILPKGTNKFQITQIEVSDLNRLEDTLKVSYTFILPDYVSLRGNNYYINLNLDRILQDITVKPNRITPIEIDYPAERTFICSLKPLAGFGEPLLPEKTNFTDKRFGFNLSYERKNGFVVLKKQTAINEMMLYPESFEFYQQLLSKLNLAYMQNLVFRKN